MVLLFCYIGTGSTFLAKAAINAWGMHSYQGARESSDDSDVDNVLKHQLSERDVIEISSKYLVNN